MVSLYQGESGLIRVFLRREMVSLKRGESGLIRVFLRREMTGQSGRPICHTQKPGLNLGSNRAPPNRRVIPIIGSRCRHCFRGLVETVGHILAVCPEYNEYRRQWYESELEIIHDEEPEFEKPFKETVSLSPTGSLVSLVRDVNIEDIMKARIPKRWAAPLSPSSCRVSDDYLRGFGSRLREFWSTVWDARDEAIRLCEDPDPTAYLRKYGIT